MSLKVKLNKSYIPNKQIYKLINTKNTMTDITDIFKDDSTKVETNWFKFDKVGCSIVGKLIDRRQQAEQGNFKAQEVYVLEKEDGEEINVGISVNKSYTINQANKAKIGDTLGFMFEKEFPSQKKGNQPSKSLEVRIKRNPDATEEVW